MPELSSKRATKEFMKPQLSDFFGVPKKLPEGTLRVVAGDVLVSENDPIRYALTQEDIPIRKVHEEFKRLARSLETPHLFERLVYPGGTVVIEHVSSPSITATKVIVQKKDQSTEKAYIEYAHPSEKLPRFDVYYEVGHGIYERDHEILWVINPPSKVVKKVATVLITQDGHVGYLSAERIEENKLKIQEKIVELRK